MGQYYAVILEKNSERKFYDIQTKGDDYRGVKLMEHSWWGNKFMNVIAKELADAPCRLAWVGDYAEVAECEKFGFKYDDVWGDGVKYERPEAPKNFSLDDYKYLVNLTKRFALVLKSYKKKSDRNGWIANPISLLTAIGNGLGCGDYRGANEDKVGSWGFDELALLNDLPKGDWEIDNGLYFKED